MTYLFYFIACVIGYIIGSLNFSIIIGKLFYKTDVREHGSKNAGATNTLRTLGSKAALFVFLLDTLKAVIAFFIVKLLSFGNPVSSYLAAASASLGHNYPIFFGFKGGKGVTVSLGALFCYNPIAGVLALLVAIVLFITTKYVSLGSIIGTLSAPLWLLWLYKGEYKPLVLVLTCILVVQIVLKHKTNIKNLLNHTERKLSFKKK